MQIDDSTNFLKNLSEPSTWNETTDESFSYKPAEEPIKLQTLEGGLPPWVSGNNFPKQYDLVRRPPLVENLFRRGEMTILNSASKLGKTWWMMNLATSLAEGIPFIGLETLKSKVIYLDLELNQADAMDRLWSIALASGLKEPPKDLYLWSLRKHCYDLDVIIETLNNRIDEIGDVGAIICEPLYMFGNSENFDENASSSMLHLLTNLEKISLKTDASLFLTHHYRKGKMGSEDHIDRGAGSGVTARMMDCIISLSHHQIENHAIFEMTSRSQKPIRPFVIKMNPPVITVAENADPTAYRRYGGSRTEEVTDERVLELIPFDSALTKQEWYSRARTQGVSESNFNTHFNSLRSNNQVLKVNRKTDGQTAYRRNNQ
jgi:hypothetical protein